MSEAGELLAVDFIRGKGELIEGGGGDKSEEGKDWGG